MVRNEINQVLKDLDALIPKKKESNHKEDGECGCKYLDIDCPCEIDVNAYNDAIDEMHEIFKKLRS